MARKAEAGIDYFPMNTDIITNPKVKLVVAEFGSKTTWAVLLPLYCKIYREKGYWIDWHDEDSKLMFAQDECKIEINVLNEVVQGCIRRSLFDKRVFDMFGVLTSDRIQENYFEATSRRLSVEFISEFLVENNCVNIKRKNVNVISLNVNVIKKKVNISTQKKKEKEILKEEEEEKQPPPQKIDGRETALLQMFKRATDGYEEDFLINQVGKFINKYPNCIAAQAGGLINSWAANLNKEEQRKWKLGNTEIKNSSVTKGKLSEAVKAIRNGIQ